MNQDDDSSSSLSEEEIPDSSRELKEINQNSWEEDSSSSSSDNEAENSLSTAPERKKLKNQRNEASQLNQNSPKPEPESKERKASTSSSSDGSGSSDSSGSDSSSDSDVQPSNKKQQSQKDKPWEENPDIYGIRRSNRSRKEPKRLVVNSDSEDSDDDDDDDSTVLRKKKKKRRKSDSWIPTLSGSESEETDSSFDVPQKIISQKKVKKINNRRPPQKRKPRGRGISTSSDEYRGGRGNKKKVGTASTRNITSKVSYKEDSEDETDSDDLIEQDEDTLPPVPAEDVETIEKVMRHRKGRPGVTGAQTTIYAEEAEHLSKLDEPDPQKEDTEDQYLIKWKTWSHLHNTWETKDTLLLQKAGGIKKLENFIKRKEQVDDWKDAASPEDIEYFEMQNEMNEDLQKQYQKVERICGHQFSGESSSSYPDYLCKWQGLPYSECTYEDGELTARFFQSYIDEYLERERSDTIPNKNAKCLRHRPKFVTLKKQPDYLGNADLQLRDYQLDGLNWLAHAWCRELSVILADEMGLGKTIQTISFLSYLFHTHHLYGPFLVVVPLSTMDAWQREFGLWGSDMNVIVYIGDVNSRTKIQEHEWCYEKTRKLKFNVLLTTYEMLLRDKDLLGSLNWACLLIDEAHRLKNDDSLLYRVLIEFRTNFRLLITGTPLQNSLKELWSLMHFIMPNKFYDWEEFESEYSIQDKEGLQKLHHDLEPYLLRRVKKDVEKSLPAKVEQILRMEMSTIQKQYYKLILTKNVKELCKELKGSFSGLLNIIVELKKCCNHSNLIKPFDGTEEESTILQALIKGSGKMILLDKLLSRLKATGHRVLIFSQMVRMLDIIADYLYLKRYAFQRLDGSIRGEQRTRALDHFNAEGSQDFCFLLSTRAGGLGINLASADTVIIFDSDWNPQNDLQAMARAHRIGQKNQVNIYRFVTKNTIEEDIIERAKKKMVLDHLIIQRMDTTGRRILSKSDNKPSSNAPFNKDELSSILKFGAEDLFKESEDSDQKLHAMDIDEILQRAETQETHEGPSVGEDLLSQFKVVNYAAFNEEEIKIEPSSNPMQKLWEEIIPEEDRKRVEEELEAEKTAALQLKPRSRKTVEKMNIPLPNTNKKVKSKAIVDTDFSSSSDSDDNDDDDEKTTTTKEKKITKKRTKATDVRTVKGLKGFTDAEIRRFIKSYKKFSRPLTRLDSIAEDAELTDKSISELNELGELLKTSCEQAVKEYQEKLLQDEHFDGKKKGASLKISGVTINAPSVLKAEEDLEILALSLPSDPKQQKTYRLTIPTRSVHWGLSWGVVEDSMLLVGMLIYGVGNWDAIKNDQSLLLSNKILPVGTGKPQNKHLLSRAEYLLKILREQQNNQNIKSEPKKKKSKPERKSKTTEGYKSPVSDNESLKPTLDKKTKKKKENNEIVEKKKKTSKKKEKVTERVSSPVLLEEAVHIRDLREELSEATFKKCKEKMRPEKKSLQLLHTPDVKASSQEQVQTTKRCLLKIGDHIERCLIDYSNEQKELDEWRSSLWSFISKFTELGPAKLYKLYRTACRKRDSHNDEKKKEIDKLKASHSSTLHEIGKHVPSDRLEMEEARKKALGVGSKGSSLSTKIPKLNKIKIPHKTTQSNNNISTSKKTTTKQSRDEKFTKDKQRSSSQYSSKPYNSTDRRSSNQTSSHSKQQGMDSTETTKTGGKMQTYKEWKEAQLKRKSVQDEKPSLKENKHSKSYGDKHSKSYGDKHSKSYGDKHSKSYGDKRHRDQKHLPHDEKPAERYSSAHLHNNRPRYNRDREQHRVISPSYGNSPSMKSPSASQSPLTYGDRKRTSSNNSDLSSSSKRPYLDEDSNSNISRVVSERS